MKGRMPEKMSSWKRSVFFVFALVGFLATFVQQLDAQELSTNRFFLKLKAGYEPQRAALGSGITLPASLEAIRSTSNISAVSQLLSQHASFRKGSFDLERILLLETSSPEKMDEILSAFSSDPSVEYAQREIVYKLDFLPNDSAYASQWGMHRIGMGKAWDKTRGSADVAVGVIDTGIDYEHPDLRSQVWINRAEDINGNGLFDPWPSSEMRNGVSGDLDGIDNDGNGFADDVIGYDFVDQPGFANAAGGDYREPDPDVLDEMGHGTSVSGIIAAETNNGIGIAGIAPDCKIMTLRAFDARGYGTESDVARALAYAVNNGAAIVNMSFGDVQYSRVLRDVIRYAYGRGVTMVASAGNAQTDRLHYPSAYDETISIAATLSNDATAGFSNFGATIDIAAPGQGITTTGRNGTYGSFDGTSASAPFVTGVAALIKSLHPEFSPEEVRGVLIASAEDLGTQGWDSRYGSGLLNAARAVELEHPSVVKILSPKTNTGTKNDEIVIVGTAASPLMTGYSLSYGYGVNPNQWTEITSFEMRQAIAETLAVWSVSTLADTTYTIRLSAKSDKGITLEDRVVVHVDRSAPVFRGFGFVPAIDGRHNGVAAGFITDEPTLGKVFYRVKGSGNDWSWISAEGTSENNLFINDVHTTFLGEKQLFPGQTYEMYFSAINEVGLEKTFRNQGVNFELEVGQPISEFGFRKKGYALPNGRLFNRPTDFNANGRPELALNDYSDNSRLKILEYDGTSFVNIGGDALGDKFPRGVGDLNRNGKQELLASFVRRGYLYEAAAPNQAPSALIAADSSSTFWPITIADVNKDGRDELLAVISDTSVGIYQLSDANQLNRIAMIVNPTPVNPLTRRNEFSAPRVAIGDFKRNGRTHLLFGDSDGDFWIVEHQGGNTFQTIWIAENDYIDASEFVAAGDFNGDGKDEFAIGVRTGHDDVIPFWFFGIYNLDGQNRSVQHWTQQFYGVEESSQSGAFTRISNSLTAGNVDDDPADELVITVFPELYVIDYDAASQTYAPMWTLPLVNTNAVTIADFDGNGINEIALATPDSIVFYERDLPYAGPPPVRSLRVEYITPASVRISWTIDRPVPLFRLYKGSNVQDLQLFGTLPASGVTDFDIEIGRTYLYAVASYDSTLSQTESPRMLSRILRPHEQPVIDTILYQQQGQLLVKVSQDLATTLPSVTAFLLDETRVPESVALIDARSLLLSFKELSDGPHGLRLIDLRDAEGIPFDPNALASVDVQNIVENDCYVERVEYIPPRSFSIYFNTPVEKATAEQAMHYVFTPLGTAVTAMRDEQNTKRVTVDLAAGTPIGAIGKEYVLKVTDVLCMNGARIVSGAGSTAGVIINKQTLDDVFVFPNPWSEREGQDFVTFGNLTQRATIRIYTVSGLFINEVKETDGNGGVEWNLRDDSGKLVPGGVYFFYATGFDGNGNEVPPKTGKFTIAR